MIDVELRVPRATYRLQLNADLTFADVARYVPYFVELGISDLYFSPILTPRAGSRHGYDITDHTHLNPELGGEEGFAHLATVLREHHLGLILDVVPNHMGIGDPRNTWWRDVLENGPSSIYAPYFDIDWDPVPPELQGKVLLPVLGDQYGVILERGELRLSYDNDGGFSLNYWEHRFPLNPRSYADILTHRLDELLNELGADHPDAIELQSIITAIGYLPSRHETTPDRVIERNREKEVVKRRIATLIEASEPVRRMVERALADYNGVPGDPRSFDLLDALIARQSYRLAFWRVATEEINYRRFFDINDLAAIRVELPEVLQATHDLVLRLLAEGIATGVRIDHPDGLWQPAAYFRQLQESYLRYRAAFHFGGSAPPDLDDQIRQRLTQAERGERSWPLYIVAEKILSHGEPLPADWAVAGTTGYDFLNQIGGVLIDRSSQRVFNRLYTQFTGPQPTFANLVNSKKKEIMLVSLASEVNTLSHLLDRLSEHTRRYRDFTLNSLTFAIREVIAAMPVYRTYISLDGVVSERDEQAIRYAVREAKRRNPRTAAQIFDFLEETLLLRNLHHFAPEAHAEVLRFVMKFQQLSGPVMAKGVEDTAFYVYNRLVALNEVGGHPELFGCEVTDLHQAAQERQQQWPHSMVTTSTHDTKRSEDVRARLSVLSELPDEWRQHVGRWSRFNAAKRSTIEGSQAPTRNDEYLLYQTLVGAWEGMEHLDSFTERMVAYMEKATREAKVNTSWINPNPEYDAAIQRFVTGILDPRRSRRFLESLDSFARRIAFFGRFNSLTQTLVRLTTVGVPDLYQGCELWDFSLVDPDNRRPVDFARRAALLAAIRRQREQDGTAALAADLLATAADGRIKLYTIATTLEFRRARPELFAYGEYVPLYAEGPAAGHVIAFARRHPTAGEAVTVAPRLTARLSGGQEVPPLDDLWGETWLPLPDILPGTRYRNLFTDECLTVVEHQAGAGLAMAEVLGHWPIALLVRE
ncbi:MAG TPA: malto-oligosyltrehalose synthase [Chloroflexus aurantiacus]|jgi:(1->4)-alpha-D-glucan 1-alpha-D-glucosylmutase|uniref:Malto-oligosyltrehalose synthase n=1 Tax=Chloroflexus aurantiacus (strain ATCC 29366 / DSM 635 / J-10-fl) TaxID=324602 RepID=A9WJB7_CHLAA|nr:malto-oligosyltrehalose synthase [Chloroflexus aurantiacus]ABY34394.1 malto-oligosyltrehalose synthase [Chloroflexus aurantiacus J-10-fl]HBW66271.1 malto-oligosyltrehalose synthase [Chloroflexus aurantiacus]